MKRTILLALCGISLALTARAAELFTNGGFETGTFGPWATTDSSGSSGSFFVTTMIPTPLNGFPTVGPSSGSYYAVSDAQGPGSHALTFTFTDPIGTTSAVLSFQIFVNDIFGASGPGGEVDLLAGGANPLTGTPLFTFFGPSDTGMSGGNPNSYTSVTSANFAGLMVGGNTYQIRIIETDVSGPINVGVDNFSLLATGTEAVPEPAEVVPLVVALAFGALLKRRKVIQG